MIRLRKLFPAWNSPADHDDLLFSIDRMNAILERERLRSDRGNSSFSLLTLALPKSYDKRERTRLARIIRRRIRVTDDMGLLAPRRIGIVLPETPADGAWKLAQYIRDLLPEDMRPPDCHVYVYPSEGEGPSDAATAEIDQREKVPEPLPMQTLFVRPLPIWKRAIDVAGASVALVILGPLMLLVAAAIKLSSAGPVIFKQWRDTIGGRRFVIYKFRTMTPNAEQEKAHLRPFSEQDGPAFKIAQDPRVTPLGRFLRVTSIDELPQLWNVLKGEMSLVGPRPLPCDESAACSAWQKRRLNVTPGLTCIWQVRGRSGVTFDEWMRMDLEYVHSRSFLKDVQILVNTVPAVLFRNGAY